MKVNLLNVEQMYSLADRLDIWELLNGVLYQSPAPRPIHQVISGELYTELNNIYRRNKKYHVRFAPYDVVLKADTLVQPDISVIDDLKKETNRCYEGAPVLVIEVLSDSSIKTDNVEKFEIYEEYGVKEYWIVDPFNDTIKQHVLENGKYKLLAELRKGDRITSPTLNEIDIDLNEVFIKQ